LGRSFHQRPKAFGLFPYCIDLKANFFIGFAVVRFRGDHAHTVIGCFQVRGRIP